VWIVYCVYAPGELPVYIGQTHIRHGESPEDAAQRRFRRHLQDAQRGSRIPFHCYLRQEPETYTEVIGLVSSRDAADDVEGMWIRCLPELTNALGSSA
jgi:hypothetical protein